MADYKPVSWNGEPITNAKLNQMSNNTQFLFERSPKIRYSANGIVRETALKVIAGKTPWSPTTTDWVDVHIYFGSFFTAGCKPVVTATAGDSSWGLRKTVVTRGFGGEIDHNGFIAHVVMFEAPVNNVNKGVGWVHWMAVGY